MNIFALDLDPKKAAEYHSDKHVVKMIVETTQILMTNYHYLNGYLKKKNFTNEYLLENLDFPRKDSTGNPNLYGITHLNHPSTVWCRQSDMNFKWTLELGLGLCLEYKKRYKKVHSCTPILNWILKKLDNLNLQKSEKISEFSMAVNDEIKNYNLVKKYLEELKIKSISVEVDTYRIYYIKYKNNINKWNYSNKPSWYKII